MMNILKRTTVLALGALFAVGCADLEVQNPNDVDRERALQTAGDVEALIAGAYGTWYNVSSFNSRGGPVLATISYQHSATAANFGMVEFSGFPKVPAHAYPSDVFSGQMGGNSWGDFWRAVSVAVQGLITLESGDFELDPDDLARANAYGYFSLGLAHTSVAVMFDQGYIYDPTIEIADVTLHPSADVFAAGLEYFDRAISEASGQSFTIPDAWMGSQVTASELVQLIHSYRARLRAAMARTPAERAAVDWTAVLADLDNGITETFYIPQQAGAPFAGKSGASVNMFRLGAWGQMSYQIAGMADQSGKFQEWFALPFGDRDPNFGGEPFLIITDDTRFPSGATIEEQQANPGTLYQIDSNPAGQWVRPDRGSHRWSYYRYWAFDDWANNRTPLDRGDWPEIRIEEMNLLRAEALMQTDPGAAADLINVTRVAAGLNATDAAGLNTSCVPKLPDGSCGDLMEMLKWEVRMETSYAGLFYAPWYFHGRGWGDLTEGSFLEVPVPCQELELQFAECYTFGATFPSSAPVGTYGN